MFQNIKTAVTIIYYGTVYIPIIITCVRTTTTGIYYCFFINKYFNNNKRIKNDNI